MPKTIHQRLNEGQNIHKAVYNTRASWKKFVSRLKTRFERMLEYEHSYLLTFTIAPEFYDLDKRTYVRKIKEALGGASEWVFNEDYGSDNGRLHFHALASYTEQLDYNIMNAIYKYGSIRFNPINRPDEKAIREYILKLTNHSIKESASTIYRSRPPKINREEVLT